jgi:SAM-dependent methyltransferase
MTFKDNKEFYKDSINEYGISAKGVQWNSHISQYKRFKAITKFIKKDISSSPIVDIGCGFAQYYKYLDEINKLPSEYIGIDCEEKMVNISRKRLSHLTFLKKNALKDKLIIADYYICSGALNILSKEEVFLFIDNCLKSSKKGFIFNFLTEESFNNIKIEEIFDFCSNYEVKIFQKDDYLKNDITFFLKKLIS